MLGKRVNEQQSTRAEVYCQLWCTSTKAALKDTMTATKLRALHF